MTPALAPVTAPPPHDPERLLLMPHRVRVYVWERPIRVYHWLLALSIVVLSFTGYYLYHPFLTAPTQTAFVMGTMRFIHEVTAMVFIIAVLIRFYWFVFGNQWSRLNQFIPLAPARRHDLWQTAKFYAFFRWRPTRHIGHNALAGAAYAVVFLMAMAEIFTGMVLFNQHLHSALLAATLGPLARPVGIQGITEIHFLLMFAFWMFLIHHLYSGLLSASEEENGLMESIFTGFKFVDPAAIRDEIPGARLAPLPEDRGEPEPPKASVPPAADEVLFRHD